MKIGSPRAAAAALVVIEEILRHEFNIAHATVQFECEDKGGHEVKR